MDKTPLFKNTNGKEKIFRIFICILAFLALTAAILFMASSIIISENNTNRLLAEAFLSLSQKENDSTNENNSQNVIGGITDSPEITDSPITEANPLAEKVEIVSVDLSTGKTDITNYTSYGINKESLENITLPFRSDLSAPLVLIIHSHPKECYTPEGASEVDATFDYTSEDSEKNIQAVGKAISDTLTSAGIISLHISDTGELGVEGTIKKYRSLYPSIKFVLDVHRDGIATTDGRIVRSDGKIESTPAAQLMLAVGCGYKSELGSWQTSLAAAYELSSTISEKNSSLMRNIIVRPEDLGQAYAPLSLSLYVGTTGNTLNEALTSAKLFAKYYALFIMQTA